MSSKKALTLMNVFKKFQKDFENLEIQNKKLKEEVRQLKAKVQEYETGLGYNFGPLLENILCEETTNFEKLEELFRKKKKMAGCKVR